jgi:hypothetical protein
MAGDIAAVATDADATKKAADERLGMELLGLAEPVSATIGAAVVEIEKLPSLPEENLLGSARLRVESAARAIRVADGGSPLVGRAAAASGLKVFRRVAGESAEGSPEQYVAVLLAGQTAALAGLPNDANRAIKDLTAMFDIDRDAALMRLARWMAADVVSSDEMRSVGTWIDGQVRASMLAGELDSAGELVALLQEIGLKHRDDALRADAKAKAAEFAQALGLLARVLDVAHEVVPPLRQERHAEHDPSHQRKEVRRGELARVHWGAV